MCKTNILMDIDSGSIRSAVNQRISHFDEFFLINRCVVFIDDSGYSAHIKGYWVSWIRGVIGVLIFIIFIVFAYYNKDLRVSQKRNKICNISVTKLWYSHQ